MNNPFSYHSSDYSGSSDGPAQSRKERHGERPTPPQGNRLAVAGLVLGIVSILLGLLSPGIQVGNEILEDSMMYSYQFQHFIAALIWLLPIVSIGVALGGLVVSFLGQMMSSRKGIALAGFSLALIGLWQAISIYVLYFLGILLIINQI